MAVRRLSLVLDLDSGQFSTRINDATGKVRVLSSVAQTASTKIDTVGHASKRSADAVEGLNKAIWKMQLTLYSVTFLFGGFTAGLVKTNAEAQRSIALLEGLSKKTDQLGRRSEAAADFRYLREFAKNAPYDLAALTDVFVKLKSVGIDPTAGAMKALVDGVANFGGNADVLHRATIAITQMAGKGVVSMEELRQQLGEAMPTALRIMARAAGKSVPEFVAEVSKGKVLWKGIQDKFFAELEKDSKGASERLMKTLGGQTSVIKTNMQNLMLAIGGFNDGDGSFAKGGFMDTLTNGARDLNSWLTNKDTIEGARELGHSLAELLINASNFFSLIAANTDVLIGFTQAFIAFKAMQMAGTAIKTAGGAMDAMQGKLFAARTTSSVSALAAEEAARTSIFKTQQAEVARAQAAVAASAAKEAAIGKEVFAQTAVIAELQREQTQYGAVVAAAVKARESEALAAERSSIRQVRANEAAGMSRTFVGASAMSAPANAEEIAKNRARLNSAELASRRQLAGVTSELAAAELSLAAAVSSSAAASVVATERAVALTAAQTATTFAARAGTAAMNGLGMVMGLVGGPIIGTLLAAAALLAISIGKMNKATRDQAAAAAQLADDTASANAAMREAEILMGKVNFVTGETANATEALAGAMKTAKGNTDGMSQALIIQTEQLRKNTIETLRNRAAKLDDDLKAATKTSISEAQAPTVRRQMSGGFEDRTMNATRAAAGFTTNSEWLDTAVSAGKSKVALITKDILDLNATIVKMEATDTKIIAANAGLFNTKDDIKPKDSKHKVTPTERMEANIDKLGASQPAINALIDSMDEGSRAAENMRAKIAGMREMGQSISKEQEARAIDAARENANLSAAYDHVKDVLGEVHAQEVNAKESVASMGDAYDATQNKIDKFNRKMNQSVAEVLRLNPALADTPERLKKLQDQAEQAKLDFTLATAADAARGLADEMARLNKHSLDPDFSSWDAWGDKIDEINAKIAAAGPRTEENAATLDQMEKARSDYSDRYIAQIESDADRSSRTTLEGLMTVDDARQAAFEREIERIKALTSTSNMSEADKAKYAVQMALTRDKLTKAAIAQNERDGETSAQRMAREWADFSGNMKNLTGDWMEDFRSKIMAGDLSFKGFMKSIFMSYLDTLLKAKLAATLQPGMDALGGLLTKFGSAIVGGMTGTTVPVHHTGSGAAGTDVAFTRTVDPRMFVGAPKFHNGKAPVLGPNEMAAIIDKREGVFTPAQMRALGGGASSKPNVQVNVINESGTQLDAQQQGGGRFDGNSYIIDVLVDAISKPGRARNAVLGAK